MRPSAAPPADSHAPPRAAPQGRSQRAGRPPRRGVLSRRPARAAAGTPAPAPQTAAWPPAQTRHPRGAPWLRSRGAAGKGCGVQQRRSSARFRAKAGTDLWEPDIFALISQKMKRRVAQQEKKTSSGGYVTTRSFNAKFPLTDGQGGGRHLHGIEVTPYTALLGVSTRDCIVRLIYHFFLIFERPFLNFWRWNSPASVVVARRSAGVAKQSDNTK